jgi:hypothetical protein
VRIPRRINTALDWWSRTVWQPYLAAPSLLVASTASAAALTAVPFLPEWAAVGALYTSGALLGWIARTYRVNALQRELDEADVRIGLLAETTRRLMRGQAVDSALETRVLPRLTAVEDGQQEGR